MGEASIDQIAAQLPFQIAKTPTLQVFQYAATQETIGSNPTATGALGSWVAGSQAAADQFDQLWVIEEEVDWLK